MKQFLFAAVLAISSPALATELKVCADPNNLPFSNQKGEGFENKLAELIAHDLGATVTYTWWAQRRGYIRNTLKARQCDLWPGIATDVDMVATTAPYYRSSYVFVTRSDTKLTSLDDPALRKLKIGVQMVGNDATNTPPAHALAKRGIIDNVRGYMLYGDYARPNPPAAIIDALIKKDIDVAVVWGPLAGYFAALAPRKLLITAVTPDNDQLAPMTFNISVGLRKGDDQFKQRVEDILLKHRTEIEELLDAYHVPRVHA